MAPILPYFTTGGDDQYTPNLFGNGDDTSDDDASEISEIGESPDSTDDESGDPATEAHPTDNRRLFNLPHPTSPNVWIPVHLCFNEVSAVPVSRFDSDFFTNMFITRLLTMRGNPLIMICMSIVAIYAADLLENLDPTLFAIYQRMHTLMRLYNASSAIITLPRPTPVTYTTVDGRFNPYVQAPNSSVDYEQRLTDYRIPGTNVTVLSPSRFAYPAALIMSLDDLRIIIDNCRDAADSDSDAY